jgi:hypothetical protein
MFSEMIGFPKDSSSFYAQCWYAGYQAALRQYGFGDIQNNGWHINSSDSQFQINTPVELQCSNVKQQEPEYTPSDRPIEPLGLNPFEELKM